jgi:hypothetical protein
MFAVESQIKYINDTTHKRVRKPRKPFLKGLKKKESHVVGVWTQQRGHF